MLQPQLWLLWECWGEDTFCRPWSLLCSQQSCWSPCNYAVLQPMPRAVLRPLAPSCAGADSSAARLVLCRPMWILECTLVALNLLLRTALPSVQAAPALGRCALLQPNIAAAGPRCRVVCHRVAATHSGHSAAVQAAQALEPAALIALQLIAPGARVVLVGDPKQLPPTVLSRAAEASHLAQSLFARLQQVCLL